MEPTPFRFGPRRGALLRGADPGENARAGTEPAVDGPGAARLPHRRAGPAGDLAADRSGGAQLPHRRAGPAGDLAADRSGGARLPRTRAGR